MYLPATGEQQYPLFKMPSADIVPPPCLLTEIRSNIIKIMMREIMD